MKLNWSPKLSVGLTEITPDTSVSDSGVIHSIQQFCFSSNHNDAYGLFLERNINKKPFKASVRQHLEKRKRKKSCFKGFEKKEEAINLTPYVPLTEQGFSGSSPSKPC